MMMWRELKNHFLFLKLSLLFFLLDRLLALLLVLLLSLLVLSFLSFSWAFSSKIEESLSSIPKYSCITFDSLLPNLCSSLLISDKVILSKALSLLLFLSLVCLISFDFWVLHFFSALTASSFCFFFFGTTSCFLKRD